MAQKAVRPGDQPFPAAQLVPAALRGRLSVWSPLSHSRFSVHEPQFNETVGPRRGWEGRARPMGTPWVTGLCARTKMRLGSLRPQAHSGHLSQVWPHLLGNLQRVREESWCRCLGNRSVTL